MSQTDRMFYTVFVLSMIGGAGLCLGWHLMLAFIKIAGESWDKFFAAISRSKPRSSASSTTINGSGSTASPHAPRSGFIYDEKGNCIGGYGGFGGGGHGGSSPPWR